MHRRSSTGLHELVGVLKLNPATLKPVAEAESLDGDPARYLVSEVGSDGFWMLVEREEDGEATRQLVRLNPATLSLDERPAPPDVLKTDSKPSVMILRSDSIVVGPVGGRLVAFDKATGEVLWRFPIDNSPEVD